MDLCLLAIGLIAAFIAAQHFACFNFHDICFNFHYVFICPFFPTFIVTNTNSANENGKMDYIFLFSYLFSVCHHNARFTIIVPVNNDCEKCVK